MAKFAHPPSPSDFDRLRRTGSFALVEEKKDEGLVGGSSRQLLHSDFDDDDDFTDLL